MDHQMLIRLILPGPQRAHGVRVVPISLAGRAIRAGNDMRCRVCLGREGINTIARLPRATIRGDTIGNHHCAIRAVYFPMAATARRAASKTGGNCFPRFAARRRMPVQAVGERQ